MARKKAILALQVEFDEEITDPESLAGAMDTLMDTAMSTSGILEEYGDVKIGAFFVEERRGPKDWRPWRPGTPP